LKLQVVEKIYTKTVLVNSSIKPPQFQEESVRHDEEKNPAYSNDSRKRTEIIIQNIRAIDFSQLCVAFIDTAKDHWMSSSASRDYTIMCRKRIRR
jgi:hypothetical protein